jgi:hypothetical protein
MAGRLSSEVLAMIRLAKLLPLPLCCASASAAERLSSDPVHPGMSASAMSSGAVLANQPHIAHSAEIMGAAMVAGCPHGGAVLHATADGVGGGGFPGDWSLAVDARKFTSSPAAQTRRRVRRWLS